MSSTTSDAELEATKWHEAEAARHAAQSSPLYMPLYTVHGVLAFLTEPFQDWDQEHLKAEYTDYVAEMQKTMLAMLDADEMKKAELEESAKALNLMRVSYLLALEYRKGARAQENGRRMQEICPRKEELENKMVGEGLTDEEKEEHCDLDFQQMELFHENDEYGRERILEWMRKQMNEGEDWEGVMEYAKEEWGEES